MDIQFWALSFFWVGGWKCVDAAPSCDTTPIILRRRLERTNVYYYYKAAFVVVACTLCPRLLVSALLSFCARLRGLVQPAAPAAWWLEREGGSAHLSRTLCFIFIKRAAFDLLPLWRVTLWTAAPHSLLLRKSCTYPNTATTALKPQPFSPPCFPLSAGTCPTPPSTRQL